MERKFSRPRDYERVSRPERLRSVSRGRLKHERSRRELLRVNDGSNLIWRFILAKTLGIPFDQVEKAKLKFEP